MWGAMQTQFANIAGNDNTLYIAIAVVLLTTFYYFYKSRGLPPGPTGLPYVGYFPYLMSSSCHLQLHELTKKYGDIFSFTVFGRLFINIGSHKAMREAYVSNSEHISNRMEDFSLGKAIFGNGVAFSNGELWKSNRKFFLQQLRERGLHSLSNNMCSGIMDERIKSTLDQLHKTKGGPVDIIDMLATQCTKIFFQTVFGEKSSEKELEDINKLYIAVVAAVNGPGMLLCGNIAKYLILPASQGYRTSMKHHKELMKMLYNIIDNHKTNFNEGNITSLVDAYLKERKDRTAKKDPSAQYFTDEYLADSLVQFIGDGVFSVAAFVCSFFQALVVHPEEQEKIYQEMLEVIGPNRDPGVDDKSKLPYTNAFISEMLRMSDVFPFFIKAICTKETYVRGYRIPKGAITLMNIWAAHFDSNVYEDPHKFNPSRFLAGAGKVKAEQPVLFGIGKRSCVGEGFTMAQVFLFLTSIVKHFQLSQPEGATDKTLFFQLDKLMVCARPRTERDSK